MRVVHVGKYYPPVPGGMERVLQDLCEGERRYVDSRVVAANDRPVTVHEEVNGVPVTRVAQWARVGSVAVCPMFPLWLRRAGADITVVHEPNPVGSISQALQLSRRPSIVWFHSGLIAHRWYYPAYRSALRRSLRQASRIVVSSPRLRDQAPELRTLRDKCDVIPFGVDPARFALSVDEQSRVAEFRWRYPGPLVLFVGRLVPSKGAEVLVCAMRGLPGTLILVGEGPLAAPLKTLANALGLGDRLVLPGALPDRELAVLYHACDVFVLPSVGDNEAFGMVQLEAMACGKPVISTDLATGVPWVNRHEETGLVVPPGDPGALREALDRLLGDEALRDRFGGAGRRRVTTEFTLDRMVERTVALYRAVLA
jgi:rhamnosyl/mannosyltransferase